MSIAHRLSAKRSAIGHPFREAQGGGTPRPGETAISPAKEIEGSELSNQGALLPFVTALLLYPLTKTFSAFNPFIPCPWSPGCDSLPISQRAINKTAWPVTSTSLSPASSTAPSASAWAS